MEVFSLVLLTNGAATDELTNQPVGMGIVEGCPKSMKGLLRPFMAAMGLLQQLRPEHRSDRNEDMPLEQEQVVHQGPAIGSGTCCKLRPQLLGLRVA